MCKDQGIRTLVGDENDESFVVEKFQVDEGPGAKVNAARGRWQIVTNAVDDIDTGGEDAD